MGLRDCCEIRGWIRRAGRFRKGVKLYGAGGSGGGSGQEVYGITELGS